MEMNEVVFHWKFGEMFIDCIRTAFSRPNVINIFFGIHWNEIYGKSAKNILGVFNFNKWVRSTKMNIDLVPPLRKRDRKFENSGPDPARSPYIG